MNRVEMLFDDERRRTTVDSLTKICGAALDFRGIEIPPVASQSFSLSLETCAPQPIPCADRDFRVAYRASLSLGACGSPSLRTMTWLLGASEPRPLVILEKAISSMALKVRHVAVGHFVDFFDGGLAG